MKTDSRRMAVAAIATLCLLGINPVKAWFDGGGDQGVGQELQGIQDRARKLNDGRNTFVVTIEKKPKEVVEEGPVLIYRYNMSGYVDYQWIIVPSEESKQLIVGVLKGLRIIDGSETVGVRTLKEEIENMQGQGKDQRAAKLTADLQKFTAVVYSYENKTASK